MTSLECIQYGTLPVLQYVTISMYLIGVCKISGKGIIIFHNITMYQSEGVVKGTSGLVQMASESMKQDQYGATDTLMFESLEDALNHIRRSYSNSIVAHDCSEGRCHGFSFWLV